jgi:protein-S-isoprenylcysteine O-methyltransferase Ste14
MFKEKIYPYFLVVLQLGSLVYLFVTAPVFARGYGGILIECVGIFLGGLAVITMKPGNFNISPTLKQNGNLVTSGIYSVIRHPMYLAQLILVLPLVIDYFNLPRLVVFILLLAVLLIKIRIEERQLAAHFPEYTDYQQKTKKLIPFIY